MATTLWESDDEGCSLVRAANGDREGVKLTRCEVNVGSGQVSIQDPVLGMLIAHELMGWALWEMDRVGKTYEEEER